MESKNIAIVGAGIGALSAAALLARRGHSVDVFERSGAAGGKLRQTFAGGPGVDAGPTVFTLKPIFEALFDAAGGDFNASLRPEPATVIARHFWDDGPGLDLFADPRPLSAATTCFSTAISRAVARVLSISCAALGPFASGIS